MFGAKLSRVVLNGNLSQHYNLSAVLRRTLTCSFAYPKINRRHSLISMSSNQYICNNISQQKVSWVRQYVKEVPNNLLVENQLEGRMKRDETDEPVLMVQQVQHSGKESDLDWEDEMKWIKSQETKDVLKPLNDIRDLDNIAPEIRPTFNLAAYVNRSETLQEMVKLGVDLTKWEKRKGISSFILKLDFQNDMKEHLLFLHDLGMRMEDLGRWLTINPLIFRETLEDLQTRANYLTAMKFNKDQIARIVTRNPNWLLFSTVRIDNRLGFFQRNFALKDDEVRLLAVKEPRLITHNMYHVKRTCFTVIEEMGFSKEEMKSLVLTTPKMWISHGVSLMRRFDFVHNQMGLTHPEIVKFPQILRSREHRIKQRHEYLKLLGRAQYDPKKPNYVSPEALVSGTDVVFCNDFAKCSIQSYNDFLKTL